MVERFLSASDDAFRPSWRSNSWAARWRHNGPPILRIGIAGDRAHESTISRDPFQWRYQIRFNLGHRIGKAGGLYRMAEASRTRDYGGQAGYANLDRVHRFHRTRSMFGMCGWTPKLDWTRLSRHVRRMSTV